MQNPGPQKIVTILPDPDKGEGGQLTAMLVSGLDRALYNPAFICLGNARALSGIIDQNDVIHCLPPSPLKNLPALYKQLKTLRPDIVISADDANLTALALKRFFPQTKFIAHETRLPAAILMARPRAAFAVKTACRRLYPRADLVITPAQTITDRFAALRIDTNNHKILPHPIDLRRIRGQGELPDRDPGKVEFLCVGRLDYQGGYDRLIEKLPKLALANWHLTIVGDGPEKRRLEIQSERSGLKNRITFSGPVDMPWPYMAAADCLLLPSRWESVPGAALESLAAGTRVIASADAGCIGEIAGKALKDAVIVAENMDKFIEAMNTVRSTPSKDYRPSLLPATCTKEAVQEKFVVMLDDLAKAP